MITKRYYWRELTDEGLLKPFYLDSWDYTPFGLHGYNTKSEARADFEKAFEDRSRQDQYVLITCYGSDPA